MLVIGFDEGRELSEHNLGSQVLIQVLVRCREFGLNGEPSTLNAGCLPHKPPNGPHAVKAMEKPSVLQTWLKPSESAPDLSRVKAATLTAM